MGRDRQSRVDCPGAQTGPGRNKLQIQRALICSFRLSPLVKVKTPESQPPMQNPGEQPSQD